MNPDTEVRWIVYSSWRRKLLGQGSSGATCSIWPSLSSDLWILGGNHRKGLGSRFQRWSNGGSCSWRMSSGCLFWRSFIRIWRFSEIRLALNYALNDPYFRMGLSMMNHPFWHSPMSMETPIYTYLYYDWRTSVVNTLGFPSMSCQKKGENGTGNRSFVSFISGSLRISNPGYIKGLQIFNHKFLLCWSFKGYNSL